MVHKRCHKFINLQCDQIMAQQHQSQQAALASANSNHSSISNGSSSSYPTLLSSSIVDAKHQQQQNKQQQQQHQKLSQNNGITDLSNLTFKNLYYLKNLSLKDNKIRTFQERAFYDLINLEELNIENNKISEVSLKYFEIDNSKDFVNIMVYLKILDFINGNKIEFKLKILNLNMNPIKFVEKNFINSELYQNLNQI